MIDQTLRIKVLIININTAELSDKIKNLLFVDSGTIFECKSYVDGTSLFSIFHDIDVSANDLNHDLEKISKWVFWWKMKFNSGLIKQAQEIIISRKKAFSILRTHG